MSSFNVFTQKSRKGGGSIPVWLGTVSPVPVGGTLASAFCKEGVLIPAGSPVNLTGGVLTPVVVYKVVASTAESMTLVPEGVDMAPTTNDKIMVPSADGTGTAAAITGVSVGESGYVVATTLNAGVGKYVVFANGTGANKAMAVKPTGYLYNDIAVESAKPGESFDYIGATGAVVVFHGEGILINRTPAAGIADLMKVAVPNVIQVEY
mgnify:CR=1 FL=1